MSYNTVKTDQERGTIVGERPYARVILASGGGTTAEYLEKANLDGVQTLLIVSDNPDAGILSLPEFKNVRRLVFDEQAYCDQHYAKIAMSSHGWHPGKEPKLYNVNDVAPDIRAELKQAFYRDVERNLTQIVEEAPFKDIYKGVIVNALGYTGHIPESITDKFYVTNNHPAMIYDGVSSGKGFYGSKLYKKTLQTFKDAEIISPTWAFTFHRASKGYDQGEILGSFRFPITDTVTPSELQELTMIFEKILTVDFNRQLITAENLETAQIVVPELNEVISRHFKEILGVEDSRVRAEKYTEFNLLLKAVMNPNFDITLFVDLPTQRELLAREIVIKRQLEKFLKPEHIETQELQQSELKFN